MLVEHVAAMQDEAMQRNWFLYKFTTQVSAVIDKIIDLKQHKVVTLDDIREQCDSLSLYNMTYNRILRLMHGWVSGAGIVVL